MKGVVIFQGTYGSTKQYAEWIGEALEFPCHSVEAFPVESASSYDLFVIGSSVRNAALMMKDWLNESMPLFEGRSIFLFSVSGTGPDEKEELKNILDRSISEDIQRRVRYFSLHGRQDFKKFPPMMRFITKIVARRERDPKKRAGMIADFDFVARENIDPIVAEIRRVAEMAEKK